MGGRIYSNLTVMGLRDMVVEIFDLFCRGKRINGISFEILSEGQDWG